MIELQSTRFQKTYYLKAGKGPALMLVHGFAEDHRIWQKQVSFLQHNFTVIVPDLPGSGKSYLPGETMSMDLLAAYLLEILDQEEIQQIQLYGHSMGGYAALAFAEKYASRLLSMGLIHSSAYDDDEEKKINRRKSISLIQSGQTGKEVFLKAMVPNLYGSEAGSTIPERMQEHLTMALEIPSESLVTYYQAMINRPNRFNVLEQLQQPVLFVLGDEDKAVTLASGLDQCYIPQQSKVEIFRNTGHTSMNENPQLLNETLLKFAYDVLELQLT